MCLFLRFTKCVPIIKLNAVSLVRVCFHYGNHPSGRNLGVLDLQLSLRGYIVCLLKGHSNAILVHFRKRKYVLTSMNAHK